MSGRESFDCRVTTGSVARTDYYSTAEWEGKPVVVYEPLWAEEGPCAGHSLGYMTHFGERTGGLYCSCCCGFTRNLDT